MIRSFTRAGFEMAIDREMKPLHHPRLRLHQQRPRVAPPSTREAYCAPCDKPSPPAPRAVRDLPCLMWQKVDP